jgi:hypothetical protein
MRQSVVDESLPDGVTHRARIRRAGGARQWDGEQSFFREFGGYSEMGQRSAARFVGDQPRPYAEVLQNLGEQHRTGRAIRFRGRGLG